MKNHLTSPRATKHMPLGIPYIIGNELAERFSFYGMKCILVVFMTKYLLDSQGVVSPFSNEKAISWYHLFLLLKDFSYQSTWRCLPKV